MTAQPQRHAAHRVRSSGGLIEGEWDDGVAISTGRELRAGAVRTARVTILNEGEEEGRFRLFERAAANSFASGDLQMVVDDVSGKRPERPVVLYRGDVGELPSDGVDLGVFAPGEERTFRFLILLEPGSPNGGQGRSAGASYEWRPVPPDV